MLHEVMLMRSFRHSVQVRIFQTFPHDPSHLAANLTLGWASKIIVERASGMKNLFSFSSRAKTVCIISRLQLLEVVLVEDTDACTPRRKGAYAVPHAHRVCGMKGQN